MRKFITFLGFFSIVAFAHAQNSTSTNAVYNGSWSGAISGTPGAFQTNTFNATSGNSALTVVGGVAAVLFDATNNFNGSVVLTGDGTGNPTAFFFSSLNTITGDLTVGENSNALFYNSTNNITGSIVVDGSVTFSNSGSGSANNTFASLLVRNSGSANLSNQANGSMTNTITSLKVMNSGFVDLSNIGGGSLTNTIHALSLSGSGTVVLGGAGNTTTISVMNVSGGSMNVVYANGGFGTTHIQNLSITDPVILNLYDSSGSPLASMPFGN